MPTSVVLDPLAQARVNPLISALKRDFGVETTQKDIVSSLVYGATAAQLVGMLAEFSKARAARDDAPQGEKAVSAEQGSRTRGSHAV
jgi:hypothetical protein